MSRKIYDYNKCYEIAQQCSCSSDMRKLNCSAYNVARKNNWIEDYTWFIRKLHKPYTREEIYEIAKKYNCSSEFQKGNGSAYGKARENGWIKDYTWFIVKNRLPYTYDECFEIAKKFKSRVELAKNNVGAYQAALKHGWLDDYVWFTLLQRPNNFWSKERVTEESKLYKNRSEFALANGSAYSKARVNGWLDEFVWLKDERIDISSGKIDCVYAYEFRNFHSVYVGRTLLKRLKARHYEHIFTESDAVYLFAKEKNIPIPDIKILEKGLTISEGVLKEEYYLKYYQTNGWNILNRAKTGSIGKIGCVKWSEKSCFKEARKYKSRGEFADNSASAYDVARKNGWLDNYVWFVEKQKPRGYWDNYDNCYNAALTCRTKSIFINKYNSAYVHAKKNGWIKDYVWFNKKRQAHNKKWDYNTCFEEAKKYLTRKDFGTKARGAYKVALKNGWIETFDWFEDSLLVLSRAIKKSKKLKWTYDVCKHIASESKGRYDFRKKSNGAYCASWKNKWLDDFFPTSQHLE